MTGNAENVVFNYVLFVACVNLLDDSFYDSIDNNLSSSLLTEEEKERQREEWKRELIKVHHVVYLIGHQ
jgi:hypothetical protein